MCFGLYMLYANFEKTTTCVLTWHQTVNGFTGNFVFLRIIRNFILLQNFGKTFDCLKGMIPREAQVECNQVLS